MDGEFETLINGQQFKKLYEKMSNIITEKYGLHKIEIEILLFLHNNRNDTAKDIAECKFFSKAHISHAIEYLTEQGYVIGKPDGQDRRCIHLMLTPKAEPLCGELLQLRNELTSIIYRGITEQEKEMMSRVAGKIARNINEEIMRDL